MKKYLVNKKETNEKIKYDITTNVIKIENIEEGIQELFKEFKRDYEELSINEKVNLLINSLGKDSGEMLAVEKIIQLISIIPFVEYSTHLSYTSPYSQGKTFQYSKIFPNSKVLSSGITEATLFYDKQKKRFGTLKEFDVLAFDDVQCLNNDAIAGSIYDFLASGNLDRGGLNPDEIEQSVSGSSVVFLSNYSEELNKKLDESPYDLEGINLFEPFSNKFQLGAFRSRLIVLPAYLIRDKNFIISGKDIYGINVNILHKFFEEKHKENLPLFVFENTCKERDKNNIYKVTSGLAKLLFNNLKNLPKSYHKAFIQIAEKLVELSFDDKLELYNEKELNSLLIELSSDFFPHPLESIIESYVYEDRCILKFKEEKDVFYKIPLTKYGVGKNNKEIKEWKKAGEIQKNFLVQVELKEKKGIPILKAYSTLSPFGNFKRIEENSLFENFNIEEIRNSSESQMSDIVKYLDYKIKLLEEENNEYLRMLEGIKNIFKILEFSIPKDSLHEYKTLLGNHFLLTKEDIRDMKDEKKGVLCKIFDISPQKLRDYNFTFDIKSKEIKLFNYDFLNIEKKENLEEEINKYYKRVNSLK